MQFDDVVRVKQVVGAGMANSSLKNGWKLLAVVPAVQDNGNRSNALYVLGKSTDEDDDEDLPMGPIFDN